MTALRKGQRPPPDRVDQALASARRAIGRVVDRLGDEDEAVVEKAAVALSEIGPFAVGPLASALTRSPSPRHRAAIIGALLTFGPQAGSVVLHALAGAMKRDPDECVRTAAQAAITSLLMAHLRQARSPASYIARQPRDSG
jgi:HEAT repeat protein